MSVSFMLYFTPNVQSRLNLYDQTILQDIRIYTGKNKDELKFYTIKYIISELEHGKQTELANRLKTAMIEVYKDLRTL